MLNTKLLASIVLVLMVMFAQVGNVAAAPQTQDGTTTISGNITNIEVQTDANGETIVVVTVEGYQPITLTAQEAANNGLFNPDTQELLVQNGDPVENLVVNPTDVIPAEPPDVHPISWLLAEFFSGGDEALANQMAVAIDDFHNGEFQVGENEGETQVFGFGVIAQALWMSSNLNAGAADTDLAAEILIAKKTGDYSQIQLPDGFTWPNDTAPTNWGQFKKALKGLNTGNDKQNLGVIISGHANDGSDETLNQQDHGKGKDKDHGKGKGKNNHP